MKIPKIIHINNRKYIFVKAYSNFILYKDEITKATECFNKSDLSLIKQIVEPPKTNINPEKVKI